MKIEVNDLMDIWANLTFAYTVQGLEGNGVHTEVIDKPTDLGLIQLECRNQKDLKTMRDALAKYGIKDVETDGLEVTPFGERPKTSALQDYKISRESSHMAFRKNCMTIDYRALSKESQELLKFFVVARAQSNMEFLHEADKVQSISAGIKKVQNAAQQTKSGLGSKGVNNLKQVIEKVSQNVQ